MALHDGEDDGGVGGGAGQVVGQRHGHRHEDGEEHLLRMRRMHLFCHLGHAAVGKAHQHTWQGEEKFSI